MRKRGSWHLAVGWQAGAGGTVFSPAALKVVDVVQTLSARGSESRPPWLRLPPENPKRAHVVRQGGRVSAQESRRHMCTAAFRKGCWAQAQAKWTRGTRASQPCRAARRGATSDIQQACDLAPAGLGSAHTCRCGSQRISFFVVVIWGVHFCQLFFTMLQPVCVSRACGITLFSRIW